MLHSREDVHPLQVRAGKELLMSGLCNGVALKHGHQTIIGKLVIGEVFVRKVGGGKRDGGRRGLGKDVSPASKRSLQWSCTEAASP